MKPVHKSEIHLISLLKAIVAIPQCSKPDVNWSLQITS